LGTFSPIVLTVTNNNGIFINNATSDFYNPPTNIEGTFYYFVEITNSIPDNGDGGYKTVTIKSEVAILTVDSQIHAQIPTITSQPTSATVIFSKPHNLTTVANVSDGGILTYRWFSNNNASNIGGNEIVNATSATFSPPTGIAGTYYYFVEVTNSITDNGDGGNKTATRRSNVITLTVNPQVHAQMPNITTQPVSATITVNNSLNLSVSASRSDGGTLIYQWYSNTSESNSGGSIITGATSSSYSLPTGTAGTYYYFVEVKNTISDNGDGGIKSASIRSNAVTIIINQNPLASDFIIGNLNQTVGNVTAVTITPKAGKTNGTITVLYNGSTALPSTAGTYTVTFNVAASTGWNAVNGLAGGTLTVASLSTIIINLVDMNEWDLAQQTAQVQPNTNRLFSVTGNYSTYKWYLDGVLVSSSSTYTFNQPVNTYQLVVVVTNSNGESRSGRCWITVSAN